jgi:hypothetical protein
MANPNRLWGRTKIRVDGRLYTTEGKSSLDIGGIKRNAVQGDFRTGLHTEEDADSKVECNILLDATVSLTALAAIGDAVVMFECDTGQTYIVNHAYIMEPPQASDGKAKCTFVGPAAEEVK